MEKFIEINLENVVIDETKIVVYGDDGRLYECPFKCVDFDNRNSILDYNKAINAKINEILEQHKAIIAVKEGETLEEKVQEQATVKREYAEELKPYIVILDLMVRIGRFEKEKFDLLIARKKGLIQDSELEFEINSKEQLSEIFGAKLNNMEKSVVALNEIVKGYLCLAEVEETLPKTSSEEIGKGKSLLKKLISKTARKKDNKQKED